MKLPMVSLEAAMARLPGLGGGPGAALVIRSSDVEVLALKGKAVAARVRVPLEGPEASHLTEALRQALASAGIKRKRFAVAIPTQDVLLRFFSIPVLPKGELDAAVPFEARKFIPFKMESLVWDYRAHPSAAGSRLDVVFAAIQEETLQRLLGAVRQAGVEPTTLEPRSLGLARLAAQSGKGSAAEQEFVAVVDVEQDAAHIAIVRNGLPYLTRDISLHGEAAPAGEGAASGLDARGQRVLSELSVSIDFFLREYPSTSVTRAYLFGEETKLAAWTAPLTEALRCPVELGTGLLGSELAGAVPLSFASAVGLLQAGRDHESLDFLRRSETKQAAPSAAINVARSKKAALDSLQGLQPSYVMTAAVVVVIGLGVLWFTGAAKVGQLRRQLQALVQARPDVGYGLTGMSVDQLKPLQDSAQTQLQLLKRIIDERTSVAIQLDALAKSRPEGLWFTSVAYEADLDHQGKASPRLVLKGACHLNQAEQEVSAIQTFEQQVRRSAAALGTFSIAQLGQVETATSSSPKATYHTFHLTCQNEAKF